jgi:hypothetical protein
LKVRSQNIKPKTRICFEANGIVGESSPNGDGWYWQLRIKWTDPSGNTIHITNPVVARDDTGCGPLILNDALYKELGQPECEIKGGRGFGYEIPHLVMTTEAKQESRFWWKLDGVEMKWIEFAPIFFRETDKANDLASLPTLGWKTQALLGGEKMMFLQKGYRRFVAASKRAAQKVVEELY